MQAIIVSGSAKEIAALAVGLQERQSPNDLVIRYLGDRKAAMDAVQRRSSGPPLAT